MAMVAILMTGCDAISGLFGKSTIKIGTYYALNVYTVQYKLSSASTWSNAVLKDESGSAVAVLSTDTSIYVDEAFFDLPGKGTYDFRVKDILGGEIDALTGCAVTGEFGSDYDYALTLSSSGALSFI